MREDRVTPTPDAAAAWERHHTPEPLPHADGITAEDGASYGGDGCDGCDAAACLVCALGRLLRGVR